jgi:pantetheine-phosphate adenylyltransferase
MRYRKVALGGTFDVIHKGHTALLDRAFSIGEHVIIGVTSDELVYRLGKSILNNYDARVMNLSSILKQYADRFHIVKLDDEFGPALTDASIEAIVVSEETESKCRRMNKMRVSRGMRELDVIVVGMVLADDGERISSTRIRSGEIDPEGRVLHNG